MKIFLLHNIYFLFLDNAERTIDINFNVVLHRFPKIFCVTSRTYTYLQGCIIILNVTCTCYRQIICVRQNVICHKRPSRTHFNPASDEWKWFIGFGKTLSAISSTKWASGKYRRINFSNYRVRARSASSRLITLNCTRRN